jgi:hypothetical protein
LLEYRHGAHRHRAGERLPSPARSRATSSTSAGARGVSGWSGFSAIQPAINAVAVGGTVNVSGGTYAQSSTLNVNKRVTLAGAGEAQTIIDARAVSGYGMLVTADGVSLRNFTLYGPQANVGTSYGIKVQPGGSGAAARLHDFSISHVTSRGPLAVTSST